MGNRWPSCLLMLTMLYPMESAVSSTATALLPIQFPYSHSNLHHRTPYFVDWAYIWRVLLSGLTIIRDITKQFKWQLHCWWVSSTGRAKWLFRMMPQVSLSHIIQLASFPGTRLLCRQQSYGLLQLTHMWHTYRQYYCSRSKIIIICK